MIRGLSGLALLLVAVGGLVTAGLTRAGGNADAPLTAAAEPVFAGGNVDIAANPIPAPANARRVVVLDPGHGGDEVGAAGFGVSEKHSNLDMAFRVERLLQEQGFEVVLTRRSDARAAEQIAGYTATRSDLQARLDLANAAQGDVFVSLHSNGSSDSSLRGVEAWYDSSRDYADEGKLLASLLKDNVLRELAAWGYSTPDRGLYDGKCFRNRDGRCFTLFVIAGPRRTTREEVMRRGGDPEGLGFNGAEEIYSRPANMPAALLESLFISNGADAAVLRSEGGRDAIARGISRAIVQFLDSRN